MCSSWKSSLRNRSCWTCNCRSCGCRSFPDSGVRMRQTRILTADGRRNRARVRALHQRRARRVGLRRDARPGRARHRRRRSHGPRGRRGGRRPRRRRRPRRARRAWGKTPRPSARGCCTRSPTRSSRTARSSPSSRRATSARRSRRSRPSSPRRVENFRFYASAIALDRAAARTRSAARCSSTR